MYVRLLIALTCLAAIVCGDQARAQVSAPTTVPTSAPTTRPSPRRELTLSNFQIEAQSFLQVRDFAHAAWSTDESRPILIDAFRATDARIEILLGIGRVLAERGDTEELPGLLRRVAVPTFAGSDRDQIIDYVLLCWGLRSPVLNLILEEARRLGPENAAWPAALALAVRFVQRADLAPPPTEKAGADRDRLHAIAEIVRLWQEIETKSPPLALALRDQLAALAGLRRAEPLLADWQKLVELAVDARRPLSEQGLAKEQVADLLVTACILRRTELRSRLVQTQINLIQRASTDNRLALVMILSDDAEVREAVIREARSVAPRLRGEDLVDAVDRLSVWLVDGQITSDVRNGLIRLAGVIGRSVPTDRRGALAGKVFDSVDGVDPVAIGWALRTILELGSVPRVEPLVAFFASGSNSDRHGDKDWIAVRSLCLRAAQLHPDGIAVAIPAVADESSAVRSDAAVALEALKGSVDAAGVQRIIAALVDRLRTETESAVRETLVQSLRGVTAGAGDALTAQAAQAVLRAWQEERIGMSTALLDIVGRRFRPGASADGSHADAIGVLAKGLDHPQAAILERSVRHLLGGDDADCRAVLVAWVGAQDAEAATRDAFVERLRVTFASDTTVLWRLAVLLRVRGGAAVLRTAIGVGSIHVGAAERGDLLAAEAREACARAIDLWRADGLDAAEVEAKVASLVDTTESDSDAAIKLILQSILAERGLRLDAAASDLSAALDSPRLRLDVAERAYQMRRLARLHVACKNFSAGITVLQKLMADGPADDLDRFQLARIRVVSEGHEPRALERLVDSLTPASRRALGDRWLLVRALVALRSNSPADRATVGKRLKDVRNGDAVVATLLRRAAEDDDAFREAVSRVDSGTTAGDEKLAELLRSVPAVRLMVLADPPTRQPSHFSAIVAGRIRVAASVFQDDGRIQVLAAEALSVMPDTHRLATEFVLWARSRPEFGEFVDLFLNDT